MTITTIDILRHGACDDGEILRGRTDSPLSPLGQQQMYRALNNLSGWQRIVSSPFSRCCAFAEEFSERLQIPLNIQPDWREVDFGVWDGRLLADIQRDDPDTLDRYYREPGSVTPEGGEPLPLASERVAKAWRHLLADCRGEHLLLISHGGAIRLLLAALQGAPLSASHFFDIPYGSLTRLKIYHGEDGDFVRLVFHGVTDRDYAQ
jgi:alpha-ribazole phosphatase